MAAERNSNDAEPLRTDVLVVGAGPSGLMAAVCLAKLGVDALIVDAKAGPTRESRALVVQARSMELYDQLGLVDRVLTERTVAGSAVPAYRTRVLGRLPLFVFGRGVTPFPEITVFEQSRNERMLVDALAKLGREVRWGTRLVGLAYRADDTPAADAHDTRRTNASTARNATNATNATTTVVATLAADGGIDQIVEARYLIGADGSRSVVRELLDIPFDGATNPQEFVVSDAVGATGLVDGAINVRLSESEVMLGFPMGDAGHARIVGMLRSAQSDAGDDDGLEPRWKAMLQREFGVDYCEATWFAPYRSHHRVARRFRDGPCFLVGDAAHIHSPVGGQGMNTGLQDAHNLACAIADVVRDRRSERRLDRYELERRPVAERLVRTTDQIFARITSESSSARVLRGRVVPTLGPVLVRLAPLLVGGSRLFGYLSQTRIRYRMSPADAADPRTVEVEKRRRDPVVGRRLRWTGSNFDALRSLAWQVHGYGAPEPLVRSIAARLGLESHVFAPDEFGQLRADRIYLVRPDGFVAAQASAFDRRGRLRRGVPTAFLDQLAG